MEYELKAEQLRFMLGITHNGVRREVIATMKPYINGKLIQLLKGNETAFIESNTDADALDLEIGGSLDENREFFNAHKISITVDGKEASDAVINKMDALYKIRTMVLRRGYFGITEPKVTDFDGADEYDLEADFAETVETKQIFELIDDSNRLQKIGISHVFRCPTIEDRTRWDRAQKYQSIKKGGRRIRYNYESIGHLYDAMIKEARGFTLDGQPCTEANKGEWIKLIPYIFKFRAVDSTFDLATEKNA